LICRLQILDSKQFYCLFFGFPMGRLAAILSRLPHFFQPEDTQAIFYQLLRVFGKTLDQVDEDLLKVMYAHYVDTANNENSQGFNTAQKGDLDRIFSLYLENLGGTSQLKQVDRPDGAAGIESDKLYRKRILGLINVLKSGASTKAGIIAIVAANLGIVGDDAAAIAARQQIHITEFLPELLKTQTYRQAVAEKFVVTNPNLIDTTPDVRVYIRSDLLVPLVDPRLVNLTTGKSVQYQGTVKDGDVLSFFANGSAFLNGVVVPVSGAPPSLPPGASMWRFEAAFGLAQAKFDQALFDFSAFDQEQLTEVAAFDAAGSRFDRSVFAFPSPFEQSESNQVAVFDRDGSNFDQSVFAFPYPAVEVNMTLVKLTPASFKVNIPWDIPGFTEELDKFGDRPRDQIKYIVDKVKAAGVFAVIAYEKRLTEVHDMTDSLKGIAQRLPFQEDHAIGESNFDIASVQIPYPGGIIHEMSDRLTTSGVFDYTQFDSLNTFA
jgi:hypothetical protein